MTHLHACPECYVAETCTMDCHIEPDLGTSRVNGEEVGYGFHHECSRCEAIGQVAGREDARCAPARVPA